MGDPPTGPGPDQLGDRPPLKRPKSHHQVGTRISAELYEKLMGLVEEARREDDSASMAGLVRWVLSDWVARVERARAVKRAD